MSEVLQLKKLIEGYENWDGLKFTCVGFLRHLSISFKQPV